MTAPVHADLRALFDAAVRLGTTERDRFVDERCAHDSKLREVLRSMLAHDADPCGFVATVGPLADGVRSASRSAEGGRIGPFRVLGILGQGSMGTVFEAEQDWPRRVVALKVLRAAPVGERGLRWFQHEAAVLARLGHPGIARLYEAGIEDSALGPQPYLAMERVQGPTIVAASAGRSVGARLELFVRVCEAVHYAHTRGVIHRDLKPANILVGEGAQPKILDFGVARLIDPDQPAFTLHTRLGQILGTVPYISPEQLEGDPAKIDPRCDVYALGVLLYELLCGRLPWDLAGLALPQQLGAIRERAPVPLRRRYRTVHGDVELIAAKAMEPDREQRYGSAAELAEDVRRHLRCEPVSARPATRVYRMRRFARRNAGLVLATALVLGALIAGGTTALWQAVVARSEAAATRAALQSLRDLLVGADVFGPLDRDIPIAENLGRLKDLLDRRFADHPLAEADIRRTCGIVLVKLGDLTGAVEMLDRAATLHRRTLGPSDPDCLETEFLLAQALLYGGHSERAESTHRRVLEGRLRVLGSDHPDVEASMTSLGGAQIALGRHAEAIAVLQDAVALAERIYPAMDSRITRPRFSLGAAYKAAGRTDAALAVFSACERELRDGAGPHAATVRGLCLQALGQIHVDSGRFSEAEAAFRQALAAYTLREGQAATGTTVCLAGALWAQGDYEQAVSLLRGVFAESGPRLPLDHPVMLAAGRSLGVCLRDMGRTAEAEGVLRDALGRARRLYQDTAPQVADCGVSLARVLIRSGQFEEAALLAEAALATRRALHGAEHVQTVEALAVFGLARAMNGAPASGGELIQEAVRIRRQCGLEAHWAGDIAIEAYAEMLLQQGRLKEAAAALRDDHERVLSVAGPERARTHPARRLLLVPGI